MNVTVIMPGKLTLDIQAVIIYDDKGNYLVHGCNNETPQEMFKKMQPLWDINPACETAKLIEFSVTVPEIAAQTIRVYSNYDADNR